MKTGHDAGEAQRQTAERDREDTNTVAAEHGQPRNDRASMAEAGDDEPPVGAWAERMMKAPQRAGTRR